MPMEQDNSLAGTAFHTIAEVADHLKVCDKTVRRWIEAGELGAHRFGRQRRISDSDFQTFLKLRRDA